MNSGMTKYQWEWTPLKMSWRISNKQPSCHRSSLITPSELHVSPTWIKLDLSLATSWQCPVTSLNQQWKTYAHQCPEKKKEEMSVELASKIMPKPSTSAENYINFNQMSWNLCQLMNPLMKCCHSFWKKLKKPWHQKQQKLLTNCKNQHHQCHRTQWPSSKTLTKKLTSAKFNMPHMYFLGITVTINYHFHNSWTVQEMEGKTFSLNKCELKNMDCD